MDDNDTRTLDSWLIGEARNHSQPARIEELLLRGADTQIAPELNELTERVALAEGEISELRLRVATTERELERTRMRSEPPDAHLLFLAVESGYTVVEADGPPPETGADVVVDDRRYLVQRSGRSPFPHDRRPCAFLVAA